MTTVVNSPNPNPESNGPMGMVIGIVLILAILGIFFVYGLPLMRQMGTPSTPQINVPSEIDVNINQDK